MCSELSLTYAKQRVPLVLRFPREVERLPHTDCRASQPSARGGRSQPSKATQQKGSFSASPVNKDTGTCLLKKSHVTSRTAYCRKETSAKVEWPPFLNIFAPVEQYWTLIMPCLLVIQPSSKICLKDMFAWSGQKPTERESEKRHTKTKGEEKEQTPARKSSRKVEQEQSPKGQIL